MRARRYQSVTFDAGNTLLYAHPSPVEIYATAMSRLGRRVESDEVRPVFASAWDEMQQRTPPGVDRYAATPGGERAWWGGFLREVLDRLDHDAPWEHLLEDLSEAFQRAEVWRLFPESVETLTRLQDSGYRLAVISNWDHRLPSILDHLGLTRFFEVITVSALEGVEKPSTEIFDRTLARLGVDSGRALHVGDSPREDYRGAEDAGLDAVLVDRGRIVLQDEYRRVATLREIVDIVESAPSP